MRSDPRPAIANALERALGAALCGSAASEILKDAFLPAVLGLNEKMGHAREEVREQMRAAGELAEALRLAKNAAERLQSLHSKHKFGIKKQAEEFERMSETLATFAARAAGFSGHFAKGRPSKPEVGIIALHLYDILQRANIPASKRWGAVREGLAAAKFPKSEVASGIKNGKRMRLERNLLLNNVL